MSHPHEEEALERSYDSRLLLWLLSFLRPHGRRVALAVALMFFHTLFTVLTPLYYKIAVDFYINPGARLDPWLAWFTRFLPPDPVAGLNALAALFVATVLLSFGASYWQTYTMQVTGQFVMFDMRQQIFRHLQRLPIAFFDRNPVGRLVTRVTQDVERLNELLSAGVVAIFGDALVLVGIAAVMLSLDWKLALLTLSVLPLIVGVTALFRYFARDAFRRTRTAMARINSFLNEHFSGMAVVQLFNREARAGEQFGQINRDAWRAWRDAIFAHAVFYPAIEMLSVLAICLVIAYGGSRVLGGVAELGTLIAFLFYARRFFQPLQDLSEKYNHLVEAMAASERVVKLLEAPVTIASPPEPLALGAARGEVEFRHVWFAYHEEQWVLQDVSFTIAPGEMAAIVGHTGAGKTTLIHLLLRFYDVQRGQILLDGADIRSLDLKELRRQFGIVLQDPMLFSGTIATNIRLGTEWISDDAVALALEQVNLSSFVGTLPEGLEHEVTERGSTLSGGQRQLLSFARALAHNPRFLILDEATSSVDTQTEFLIRDALTRLIEGRTSIVIAHRLSTVQRADKILVLHKGRLREQGSHQALLARRGIYHKLYQLQYRDQEVGAVADDD